MSFFLTNIVLIIKFSIQNARIDCFIQEVTYPLDEKREVTVRKSFEETNGLDNSGDYTKYEKNELLPVGDGVNLNVRKNGDKIYVMYFAAESGVYSARCEEGMNDNEAIGIFNTIKEAETKYLNLIP